MRLPRRIVLLFLGAMMMLSVALRYPHSNHELGVDSFFIHNLATNVVNDGYAEWLLNPLSLFGWFPMSYPTGGPFLIAGVSSIGDVPVEGAILLLSLLFGAFGVLTSFVMAREFRDDPFFCLVATFLYAFAPRFLAFTLWSASMRSLFMVLLPAFIWAVLRAHREPKAVNFALVLGLFFLLAATHRLAALLAVVLIASFAAIVVLLVLRLIRISAPKVFLASRFRRTAPYVVLIIFLGVSASILFGTNLLDAYSTGELATGTTLGIELLNLGVSLARSVGLAVVFSVVGIVVLVRLRNKTLREPFLLLSFLGLTPTLFLRQYTGFYILPFISLFAALAFIALLRVRRHRLRAVAIVLALTSTLAFSVQVLGYEIDHSMIIPATTYGVSLYLRSQGDNCRLIANDGLMAVRVAAVSGCRVLPVGGAGTTFQSPELLAYHFYTREEVERRVVRLPLQDLTLESDSLWEATGIQAELDWVNLMQTNYNTPGPIASRYAPSMFLESKTIPDMFFAYGNKYPSSFAVTSDAGAYRIYDDDAESAFYVAMSQP